jgi:nanoRNase/pAp phosphatase (c-di-AMP/oligoRNAs hydrolase)
MYGDKDKFMELDEAIRGNVTFVNHSKVAIKGKCTILIKLKDESYQFIGDVYYISNVKSNILSLGQLLEKGYEIKMKDRTLTLLDTKEYMIAKVVMTKNKMFLPNIEMNVPKSLNDCKKYDLLPILDEEEEKLKIIKNL